MKNITLKHLNETVKICRKNKVKKVKFCDIELEFHDSAFIDDVKQVQPEHDEAITNEQDLRRIRFPELYQK